MLMPLFFLFLLHPSPAWAHFTEMPVSLMTDWRYWLFLTVYVLITAKLVIAVHRTGVARDRGRSLSLKDVNGTATIVLTFAIVYQILHHYEHVSQFFQYWYLGQYSLVSHGIIFFLDLEWNHFLFDAIYFLLLAGGMLLFVRTWRKAGHPLDRLGACLLYGTLVVQGWHTVEHTYRIVRHIRLGCEPCHGIVDSLFGVPLIPLHFWFNVFALTLPLLVYVSFGMHRKLMAMAGGR